MPPFLQVFEFGAVANSAARSSLPHVALGGQVHVFPSRVYLGTEVPGQTVGVCLALVDIATQFSRVAAPSFHSAPRPPAPGS